MPTSRSRRGADVEHAALDLGDPDLRPCRACHRRDGTDVIEVRVGEEDAGQRQAEPLDRGEQLRRLLARIDDLIAERRLTTTGGPYPVLALPRASRAA